MTKFCTECGKEIAADMAFCTECGTKAPADPAPESVAEVKIEPKVETKPEVPVHTPQAQTYQSQQTYSQPVQTVYAPPAPDPTSKVVSTGAYVGLMLLFALPIIGFIACLIMAFAVKNKNIKNYARATLIWMIITFVILAVIGALIAVLANAIGGFIEQIMGDTFSQFEDVFGQFGDISEQLGGITEQFENGGNGNLPLE